MKCPQNDKEVGDDLDFHGSLEGTTDSHSTSAWPSGGLARSVHTWKYLLDPSPLKSPE